MAVDSQTSSKDGAGRHGRSGYGRRMRSAEAAQPLSFPAGIPRIRCHVSRPIPAPTSTSWPSRRTNSSAGPPTTCSTRSVAQREGAPPWVFYEGPPTANGQPGLHHVWARVYKDLFCRFRTMRGHYVARRAGWDTHGLPVEVEVEKRLGITGKRQIEDEVGIAEFVRLCRESVYSYVDEFAAS